MLFFIVNFLTLKLGLLAWGIFNMFTMITTHTIISTHHCSFPIEFSWFCRVRGKQKCFNFDLRTLDAYYGIYGSCLKNGKQLTLNAWKSKLGMLLLQSNEKFYMGHVARKPVFGVSDKASFKAASSATETG